MDSVIGGGQTDTNMAADRAGTSYVQAIRSMQSMCPDNTQLTETKTGSESELKKRKAITGSFPCRPRM